MRLPGCLALVAAAAALCEAGEWELRYSFPNDETAQLRLKDFRFAGPSLGLAIWSMLEKSGPRTVALITRDGGRTWKVEPQDLPGQSLFFVNESLGWIVSEEGILRTTDAARHWENLGGPRGMLRVYFVNERRGWAVGTWKRIYETSDGGETWSLVPAAAEPSSTAEFTTYGVIDFAGPQNGIIAGWTQPRHTAGASAARLVPALTILLDTRDGGVKWVPSVSTIFGHISRIRLSPEGRGLGLVEFNDAFEWPSEVFLIEWKTGRSSSVFRDPDHLVTDLWLSPRGEGLLAAVEAGPAPRDASRPAPIKVFQSQDLTVWTAEPVPGTVRGTRGLFSSVPGGRLWLATDSGAVLEREMGESDKTEP